MMIVYREIQQMIIFFTGKNALVVILQLYRIIVLKVNFSENIHFSLISEYTFLINILNFKHIIFLSFV